MSISILIVALGIAQTFTDDGLLLVSRLRDVVPRSGIVEVIHQSGSGTTEFRVGVDFATGAWYHVQPVIVMGRTPDGRSWASGGNPARPAGDNPDPWHRSMLMTASVLPDVFGWIILRDPSLARNVTRTENGFTADFVLDQSTPDRVIHLVFDAEGRLVSSRRSDMPDLGMDLRGSHLFADSLPATVRVLRTSSPGTSTLVSAEFRERATPDSFSIERVEALGAVVRYNQEKAFASQVRLAGESAPSGLDAPSIVIDNAPTPGQSWRWTLLITGLILALGGGGVWIWKRTR